MHDILFVYETTSNLKKKIHSNKNLLQKNSSASNVTSQSPVKKYPFSKESDTEMECIECEVRLFLF